MKFTIQELKDALNAARWLTYEKVDIPSPMSIHDAIYCGYVDYDKTYCEYELTLKYHIANQDIV